MDDNAKRPHTTGDHAGMGATTLDQNRGQQQSGTTDQALQQAKSTANQAIDHAKTMARNIGEQARAVAADPNATAQELARQAREQAPAAGEYLTQNVNEYPLTALLIAGMIGYGLAFLVHTSWQGQGFWGNDR